MLTRHLAVAPPAIAVTLCSVLLLACSENSLPNAATTAAEAKSTAASKISSPGKRRSPIIIEHPTPDIATVGKPLTITLSVGSRSEPGQFELHLRSSAPQQLALANSQPVTLQFELPDSLSYVQQTVTLMPYENGRYYLQISASLQTPNGRIMRPYSIPIQVGPAAAKVASQKAGTEDQAERGVSIPARMD